MSATIAQPTHRPKLQKFPRFCNGLLHVLKAESMFCPRIPPISLSGSAIRFGHSHSLNGRPEIASIQGSF
jgi:hypothetical protein